MNPLTRPLALSALLLATHFTLGCLGAPVPTVARAGTTIGIALGDGEFGGPIGYGTSSLPDPQRGATIFELYNSGGGFISELPARVVTRSYPDPSSPGGLAGTLSGVGTPQQVLALLDIPGDVAASVPGVPYEIRARQAEHAGPGAPAVSTSPTESVLWKVEVLDSPGFGEDFTAFETELFGTVFPILAAQVRETIPYPKLLFALPAAPTAPAAATIDISFDDSRVDILGVHLNRIKSEGVFVRHEIPAPGLVRVHYVNTDPAAGSIAIVFAHDNQQSGYDPLSHANPSDFDYVTGKFYDADGVEFTPSDNPDLWAIQ